MANRRITVNAAGEPITCDNRRIPAPLVEEAVLRSIAEARLPDEAVEAARGMAKERLAKPTDDAAETKRRRLEKAAEALRKQHTWGELTDDEYRTERREIEAALAALPARSTDTLVAFDEARARLLLMPEAMAAASDERRAEIAAVLIGRVEANRTTGLTGLEWTPPAAPLFRAEWEWRAKDYAAASLGPQRSALIRPVRDARDDGQSLRFAPVRKLVPGLAPEECEVSSPDSHLPARRIVRAPGSGAVRALGRLGCPR